MIRGRRIALKHFRKIGSKQVFVTTAHLPRSELSQTQGTACPLPPHSGPPAKGRYGALVDGRLKPLSLGTMVQGVMQNKASLLHTPPSANIEARCLPMHLENVYLYDTIDDL